MNAVPHSHTGAAAGMNANIRTVGGAIGAAMVATVLGSHAGASGDPSEHGWVNEQLHTGLTHEAFAGTYHGAPPLPESPVRDLDPR